MTSESETDYDDGDPYSCIAYGYWQSRQMPARSAVEQLEEEIGKHQAWGVSEKEPELLKLLNRDPELSRLALKNLWNSSRTENPKLARWVDGVMGAFEKQSRED